MSLLSQDALAAYWTMPMVEANAVVFFKLIGALLLGLLVGLVSRARSWDAYVWFGMTGFCSINCRGWLS